MFVGVLCLELFIPESGSLKSKRRVLYCLKDRIRANFNVSVSETDEQDKWQRAQLGIACVGPDKKYINGILSRINDMAESYDQARLISSKMEII